MTIHFTTNPLRVTAVCLARLGKALDFTVLTIGAIGIPIIIACLVWPEFAALLEDYLAYYFLKER